MRHRRITRRAKVGDMLHLNLTTPGASGYVWTLVPPTGNDWRVIGAKSGMTTDFGQVVPETLDVEVLRSGKSVIAAELRRPWESEAIERLDISIEAT